MARGGETGHHTYRGKVILEQIMLQIEMIGKVRRFDLEGLVTDKDLRGQTSYFSNHFNLLRDLLKNYFPPIYAVAIMSLYQIVTHTVELRTTHGTHGNGEHVKWPKFYPDNLMTHCTWNMKTLLHTSRYMVHTHYTYVTFARISHLQQTNMWQFWP